MLFQRPLQFLAGFLLCTPAALAGTVIYADAGLTTGLNDGSSWDNAFQGSLGLRDALAVAVAGDDVYVAQGTYLPNDNAMRGVSFRLETDIGIYGSFLGGESGPAERPPFGTADSILSADLNGDDGGGGLGDNSYHLLRATGVSATALIDGFVITGGNSNAGGNNDRGGGILCLSGANPTVRNCRFIGNRCTFGGGAGYVNGSAPAFLDCTFENNTGGSFGGAFDIAGAGAIRFERCYFSGNTASRAGALEIFQTTGALISDSVFWNNTATGNSGGGGLWMGSGGSTTIVGSTVVGNNAPAQAGAGLRNQGSTVTAANCIFYDNSGPGGAQGATNQVNGTVGVTYSIVEGGLAGTGNLSADPQFADAGSGDFRLGAASPGIDAGNNNAVPAGITSDFTGAPRFVDVAAVADTGNGVAPLVDIGAHELADGVGDVFCSGNTGCPCGNDGALGAGCLNSTGVGASLSGAGSASAMADDLVFSGADLGANKAALLFAGTTQAGGGAGNPFGDGLRCAQGTTRRLGVRVSDAAGVAQWGPGLAAIGGFGPGDTRHFQLWYRDPMGGPCMSGFNLSNGLSVQFQ